MCKKVASTAHRSSVSTRPLGYLGLITAPLTAIALATTVPLSAHAQTFSYIGAFGGSWDVATNWYEAGANPPYVVPNNGAASVYISDAMVEKYGGVLHAGSIYMDPSSSLQVVGDSNFFASNVSGGTLYLTPDSGGNEGSLHVDNQLVLSSTQVVCQGVQDALFIFPNASITVESTSEISGGFAEVGAYSNSTFTNYGIVDTTYQGAVTFLSAAMSNYGTIEGSIGTGIDFYTGNQSNMAYGVINANGGRFSFINGTFTNSHLGEITTSNPIYISNDNFTNNGNIDVTGGLQVYGTSNFSNNGTVQLSNGDLTLTGAFSNNGQLTLNNSSLTVGSGGTFTSSTGPINPTVLNLNGGTIYGSTIDAITIAGNNTSVLSNVALSGSIAAGVTVTLTNSSIIGGTIDLTTSSTSSGVDSVLAFAGNGSNSTITNTTINFSGGGDLGIAPGGQLTLGAGTVLQGSVGQLGFNYGSASGSKLINNGTINVNVSGDRDFIDPAQLTNNGVITASNSGELDFCFGGNATNSSSGQVTVNSGFVNIFDGTFTNNGSMSISNGSLGVIGGALYAHNLAFSNVNLGVSDGGILDLTGTGSLSVTGMTLNGTVNNGSITIDETLASGNGSGDGDLRLSGTGNLSSTTMNLTNGVVYSDNTTNLTIDSHSTLAGQISQLGGDSSGDLSGTLTNSGTITLSGTNATLINFASVTNKGTIQTASGVNLFTNGNIENSIGASISVGGSVYVFGGTLSNDGTLSLVTSKSNVILYAGALSGTGTINGSVINAAGMVQPGDAPGTLTINGNFTQGSSGTTLIELGGGAPGSFGVLDISGTASLGGTLELQNYGGFTPTVGEDFDFLNAGSTTGFFSSVQSLNSGYTYNVVSDGHGGDEIEVLTSGATSTTAAPEPNAVFLLLPAVPLMARIRRRRRLSR